MAPSERLSTRALAAVAALIAGCGGGARWHAHLVYRPLSGAWGSVELRLAGSRAAGQDVSETCAGSVQIQGAATALLSVAADPAGPVVTASDPPGLVAPGTPLTAAVLRAASPTLAPAESTEILQILTTACLGPKVGVPALTTLAPVTVDVGYD